MSSVDSKTALSTKPVWLLLPVLMGLFQSSLIAATPTFISVTGLSTLQWSLLLSMPTLLFLLLSPLWGKWADRIGASYLIRYSTVGLGLSIVSLAAVWWLGTAFAFVPALWFVAIAVTRILYGISASGVMPLCQSLAINDTQPSDSTGKAESGDRSLKNLGLVSASLSSGRLVGPLVLIAVLSQLDWLLALYSLLAIPLVWLVIQYSRRHAKKQNPKTNRSETIPVKLAPVLPYLVMAFCVTLFVGYLQFVLGPLLLDWLGDAKQATMTMSFVLTLVATSALLCQLLIVKHLNWRSPFLLAGIALTMLGATLTLSIINSVMALMLIMVPVAAAIALITPIYTRSAMAQCDEGKGQISGKLAVCHTAGYPLGSLLAGLYYPAFEIWWLPLALIAFTLVCVTLIVLWSTQAKPKPIAECQ